MTVVRRMDLRVNIKKYFDMAFSGEPVFVLRKKNKNVVVVSETRYNDLMKAERNVAYLEMLDQSMAEAESGGFMKSKKK